MGGVSSSSFVLLAGNDVVVLLAGNDVVVDARGVRGLWTGEVRFGWLVLTVAARVGIGGRDPVDAFTGLAGRTGDDPVGLSVSMETDGDEDAVGLPAAWMVVPVPEGGEGKALLGMGCLRMVDARPEGL